MSQVPVSEKVYYKDRYWNEHTLTQDYHSRLIMGSNTPACGWIRYVKKTYYSNKKAKKALFINCGNGWAERDMFSESIFEECVGFDFSESLLNDARNMALDLPFEYFQADCNTVLFEPNSFDLIVNVAAMHHVQYIERLHQELSRALIPDGLYINFDYIGPHRNQYSDQHWLLIERVNDCFPYGFRAEAMQRPDLKTMLLHDPTEAIHSELIMECFYRYFHCIERKDLNGGIAYHIMFNNDELYWYDNLLSNRIVSEILCLDEIASHLTIVPSLFSFFVGVPNKEILNNVQYLQRQRTEEEHREQRAVNSGGLYL